MTLLLNFDRLLPTFGQALVTGQRKVRNEQVRFVLFPEFTTTSFHLRQ